MAGEDRTSPHVVELLEQLRTEPYAFDFFQAIRLLDCAQPQTPQTGRSQMLKDDPFRIGQEPSAAFAPSTLADLEPANDFHPPRLIQRFFGMMGPQGPLPMHLTDYAYSRIHHHHDQTLSHFFDIFHHRLATLFYQAWAAVRPTANFDLGSRDRFGDYVNSVFGLGMRPLMGRDALPDRPKRHYSGMLSCQTKHAEGLLAILKGYFGLPVDIEQFVGQWIELPTDCQCRMGESANTSMLGKTLAIGSHVWDCQQKFRIVFGPLALEDYYNLLPVNVEILADDGQGDDKSRSELAETVLLNGQIYTAKKNAPWATALAIRDGRVIRVGSDQEIAKLQYDKTRIIDLAGATVLPGLLEESIEEQEMENDVGPHRRWRALETLVAQASGVDQAHSATGTREAALNAAVDELLRIERSLNPPELRAGSIKSGTHADLTMIDQDLRSLVNQDQIDRIRGTRVMMAMFDGKLIYDIRSTKRADAARRRFLLPANCSRAAAGSRSGSSESGGGETVAPPSDGSPRDVSLDSLVALVRGYVGDSLQWDAQLILRGDEAPPLGLGLQGHLGWTTWLLQDKLPHDSKDLTLDAMNVPRDTSDQLRYWRLSQWDSRTLGQRRDGSIVSSTSSPS